jgi:uncharacterized membrane protein YGL010W
VVGRDLTYSFWIGSSGSLPAAAMQAKMAMMTRRMARYFIFSAWFGLFSSRGWVIEFVGKGEFE